MPKFVDTQSREWLVDITVATIKRVRSICEVDLLEAMEGKVIDRLYRDPILLVDVLYAVCKPEADQRSITDEDFGRAMAGDAIEHATKALIEALVSFCPNQRDRAALGRVIETTNRAMEKARDIVEERTSQCALDRVVDAAVLRATAGSSFGNVPGSSE